jgi:hypothetical protein
LMSEEFTEHLYPMNYIFLWRRGVGISFYLDSI